MVNLVGIAAKNINVIVGPEDGCWPPTAAEAARTARAGTIGTIGSILRHKMEAELCVLLTLHSCCQLECDKLVALPPGMQRKNHFSSMLMT